MPDAGGVGFGFQHSPKSARPRRARACSRRTAEILYPTCSSVLPCPPGKRTDSQMTRGYAENLMLYAVGAGFHARPQGSWVLLFVLAKTELQLSSKTQAFFFPCSARAGTETRPYNSRFLAFIFAASHRKPVGRRSRRIVEILSEARSGGLPCPQKRVSVCLCPGEIS